jgi:PilZ domain
MSHDSPLQQQERRRNVRIEPPALMMVEVGGESIPDAAVLNVSRQGAALRTSRPIAVGARVAFNVGDGRPPIVAEVLACEPLEEGGYRVRCQCPPSGFETLD